MVLYTRWGVVEAVCCDGDISVQVLTAAWEVGKEQQTPNLPEAPKLCERLGCT